MNIITKSVNEIQNIYQRVIGEIKDKKEKEIIHCLFQDLSDKLLDNVKEEELEKWIIVFISWQVYYLYPVLVYYQARLMITVYSLEQLW